MWVIVYTKYMKGIYGWKSHVFHYMNYKDSGTHVFVYMAATHL